MKLTRDEMDRIPHHCNKIQHKNCGYAMVQDKVFCSVIEAEYYCYKNGIDMDTWIRADDPEVLKECKAIVKAALPLLEMMLRDVERKWNDNRKSIESCAETRNRLQKLSDEGDLDASWNLDGAQRSLTEAIWTGHGLYEAMEEVRDQIADYREILRIKEEVNPNEV